MIKFDVRVTLSKVMAFLILGLAFGYTYVEKDAAVFITGIGASAGLMGIKTGFEAFKK